MYTNGWIILHRKCLTNEIFLFDPTAWRVFEILLLIANHDTGIWKGGGFQLTELTQLKYMTQYKALQRLEKSEMIKIESKNKYSVIRICNWQQYQHGIKTNQYKQDKNEIKTNSKQDKTLITNNNKQITNNTLDLDDPLKEAIEQFIKHRKTLRKPASDYAIKLLRNKLNSLYPGNFEKQIEKINEAIEHGWLTVWESDSKPEKKSKYGINY